MFDNFFKKFGKKELNLDSVDILSDTSVQDIYDLLLRDNKFEGTSDIYDFIRIIDDMGSDIVSDEDKKYKTAYKILKNTGTSKKELLHSVAYYIGLVVSYFEESDKVLLDILTTTTDDISRIDKNTTQRIKELEDKLVLLKKEISNVKASSKKQKNMLRDKEVMYKDKQKSLIDVKQSLVDSLKIYKNKIDNYIE